MRGGRRRAPRRAPARDATTRAPRHAPQRALRHQPKRQRRQHLHSIVRAAPRVEGFVHDPRRARAEEGADLQRIQAGSAAVGAGRVRAEDERLAVEARDCAEQHKAGLGRKHARGRRAAHAGGSTQPAISEARAHVRAAEEKKRSKTSDESSKTLLKFTDTRQQKYLCSVQVSCRRISRPRSPIAAVCTRAKRHHRVLCAKRAASSLISHLHPRFEDRASISECPPSLSRAAPSG